MKYKVKRRRTAFVPPLPRGKSLPRIPSKNKTFDSRSPASAKRQVDRMKLDIVASKLKQNGAFEAVAPFAKAVAIEGAKVIAQKVIENIAKPNSPSTTGPETVPSMLEHKAVISSSGTAMAQRKTHRTSLDTGMPIPKVLKMVKKMNGSHRRTLLDSKVNSNFRIEFGRQQLNHSHGFNSKRIWFCPLFTAVTPSDVLNTAGIAGSQRDDSRASDRVYLATEYVKTEFAIYNQNAYFPTKVKIHLVAIENPPTTTFDAWREIFTRTFNGAVGPTQQNAYAVPVFMQHEGTVDVLTANEQHVAVSNKLRLTDSSYFRDNCKIVKTISKTLGPTDTWFFNHKHHTGSGLDAFGMLSESFNSVDTPIAYYYVMEMSGVPCEAVYRSVANEYDTYLGTSPGNTQFEFKKEIRFIAAGTASRYDFNEAGGGLDNSLMHMRVWRDEPYRTTVEVDSKEFFSLQPKISSNIAVGETYIPVITDKVSLANQATSTVVDGQGD